MRCRFGGLAGFALICVSLLAQTPLAQSGILAQFHTSVGDMEVELFDQDKPVTVANFKRYIENNAYQDCVFHRSTVPPQVVVIQGGWLTVTNRASLTNWGFVPIPTFDPIVNEIGVGTFYSNVYGTLAMAKTADPDSATSQFFFNLADNSAALDDTNNSGGFTVFGRVVGGTNVLNKLDATHPDTEIERHNFGGAFTEFPLLATVEPPAVESDELVYVDVTLLSVEIRRGNNVRQISWNSVADRVNVVEFTTVLPPAWNTLLSTNGTGSRIVITESSDSSESRFYRVRVLY